MSQGRDDSPRGCAMCGRKPRPAEQMTTAAMAWFGPPEAPHFPTSPSSAEQLVCHVHDKAPCCPGALR